VCSRTGGHIGAGLGVVELTVALHTVFDMPGTSSSGTSGIRDTRTSSSPEETPAWRHCGRRADCPVS
jgi:hypothetical protein